MIWLTALETSEAVGIPTMRIALIEQKSPTQGHAVAIHLDTGKELRVMESLADVRARIEAADIVEKDFT